MDGLYVDRTKVRPLTTDVMSSNSNSGLQIITSTMRELANALPAWEQLSKYSSLEAFKHALCEAEEELPIVTGLRSLCWKVSSLEALT
jgi:hypothetical protein